MFWYISYMYFSRLLFSWVRICMHICRRRVRGQERGMTWLEVVKIDKVQRRNSSSTEELPDSSVSSLSELVGIRKDIWSPKPRSNIAMDRQLPDQVTKSIKIGCLPLLLGSSHPYPLLILKEHRHLNDDEGIGPSKCRCSQFWPRFASSSPGILPRMSGPLNGVLLFYPLPYPSLHETC